jgi:hypothetical protein
MKVNVVAALGEQKEELMEYCEVISNLLMKDYDMASHAIMTSICQIFIANGQNFNQFKEIMEPLYDHYLKVFENHSKDQVAKNDGH